MGGNIVEFGATAIGEKRFLTTMPMASVGGAVKSALSAEPQSPQLRVLTLTPFYPSVGDPTQGRFISEPLAHIDEFAIANETIAIQPFYRRRALSNDAASWMPYFSIPTNLGLPIAGEFLAKRLLPSLINEHGPFHLIHAHGALPCGHAARILSRHLSIPFVVTVHGLDAFFDRQARGIIGSCCRRVAARVYRSAESVICISEKVRSEVQSGVCANTTLVCNGVDTDEFSPGTESSSPSILLSVGNLIPIKGHALLLRSFAKVSAIMPDCVLKIIGEGPERKRLSELAAQLGLAGKVEFLGRRSKQQVADAMRRCAVFALPSVYEGLGCVYLEAMACAKPVIGCHSQGIDEILDHGTTGMLVKPGNEAELSNSLRVLLENSALRRRIGMAAREKILRQFTLKHQARALADVYQGCFA